ncbi:chorismate lyase [Simiduia sp. 21SJ11W-1]|uniref:chorismate--pyruvate lyase family protein n=1 Tax=Simiduia sp. 21SJ11W-1 TaxID=2909669 RepID=UPI00209D9D7F|nr:chorismate lyase [Simiduia sp. 21SJ11W-1]UTA47979.1 chorismate lyase [Simiduia sp. 21SJ11W-1]
MSPTNPREPHWRDAQQVSWQLPKPLLPWLLDEGSLTARLIEHSQQRFAVDLLAQGWGEGYVGEYRLLNSPLRQKMLVREVILQGAGRPWVYARSLVPVTSLQGRLKALKQLDNRPLGALLFQDPGMQRGPIQVAEIRPAHGYLHASAAPQTHTPLWGRRSVFYLDQQPLLVSEVFLPDFLRTL